VAAQDQTDTAVAIHLHEVGIMREKDRGIALGGVAECSHNVLTISPEVTNTADSKPAAFSFEPDPCVVKLGKFCLRKRCPRTGLEILEAVVISVVVVAPNCKRTDYRLEFTQCLDCRRDVALMSVYVITAKGNNVWLQGIGHCHNVLDVGQWYEWPVVYIG
jgi:hypothetical protein